MNSSPDSTTSQPPQMAIWSNTNHQISGEVKIWLTVLDTARSVLFDGRGMGGNEDE